MKQVFLLSLFCFLLTKTNAQVGIGNVTPNVSAQLEVSATNKGVLIPRLSLTSASDAVTVPSPATYLMVVNTNAALQAGAGLYMNMGSPVVPNWTKIGQQETIIIGGLQRQIAEYKMQHDLQQSRIELLEAQMKKLLDK